MDTDYPSTGVGIALRFTATTRKPKSQCVPALDVLFEPYTRTANAFFGVDENDAAFLEGHQLFGKRTFDGFRIAIDHGQQNAGGAVGNTTALLPILEGASIKAETVRELLTAQLHAFA